MRREARGKLQTTTLPNGLRIAFVSRPDVSFLYREIFSDPCCYLRGGVACSAGDTVVDVGANIGFFALRAAELVGSSVRQKIALVPIRPLAPAPSLPPAACTTFIWTVSSS